MIDLIYCANGNPRFAQIAIEAGFLYGAQMPGKVYAHPYFVDQNWKRPNKDKYIAALAKHKPSMASVLDWERLDQLSEVLEWAEEAARFVEIVMIIPKVPGKVDLLPRIIGGKRVRLGYSIPTRHGGTAVWPGEFYSWPIHLLGGNPHAQMKWRSRLPGTISADGNMFQKMAVRFCQYWQAGKWIRLDADGQKWGEDAPYEAFRRSCINIRKAWLDSQSIDNLIF